MAGVAERDVAAEVAAAAVVGVVERDVADLSHVAQSRRGRGTTSSRDVDARRS